MRIHFLIISLFFFASATLSVAGDIPVVSLRGNGLMFTENKGQIVDVEQKTRPDVLFKGCGKGTDIYIRKTGISYVASNLGELLQKEKQESEKNKEHTNETEQKSRHESFLNQTYTVNRIDVEFLNGNAAATIETADQVEGYTNFYLAHCPQGVTHVNSYNNVIAKNIYKNIDVNYYGGKGQGLKYDIIINPGGDPSDVKLKYSGMEMVYTSNNHLYIKTVLGELEENIPVIYQEENGKRIVVDGNYILQDNQVSFNIPKYNKNLPLIIDPWVTYFGGTYSDVGISDNVDKAGNVIFTGYAGSTNFPVSSGAYQLSMKGYQDVFVAKMNPAGGRVFSTYFGGTGPESGNGIVADGSNNILVCGQTGSADLPIANPGGAYTQAVGGGISDAFVAEFSSAGILIWSTYYGGNGDDKGSDICCDAANNICITGYTVSTNFPVSAGAYQTSAKGSDDCFVVKFNSSGIRQWATYYGGSDIDDGIGIDCDLAGNIFFTGRAASSDFPISAGAYQTLMKTSGGYNGQTSFIVRLNPATGFPVWSTYFGGTQLTDGFGVACDHAGNIAVTGYTYSTDFPLKNAYQNSKKGLAEAYVAKFDATGNLLWSTYLGGSSHEEPAGIVIDAANNIIVSGDTYSTDYPVTSCAYQQVFKGTEDQYITKFDSTGQLICSSYLGEGNSSSTNNETTGGNGGGIPAYGGGCIAAYGCYVYLVASTSCDYPVTSGAFQTTCGVYPSNFVVGLAKLYSSTCGGITSSTSFSASSTTFCKGLSADFTSTHSGCGDSATYLWNFSGGTPSTSTLQNPTGITYTISGTYDVSLIVQSACGNDTLKMPAYIVVQPCGCTLSSPVTLTNNVSCHGGTDGNASVSITSGSGGVYTYSWSNGISGTTSATSIPLSDVGSATYTVTIVDGSCSSTSTVKITEPVALTIAAVSKDATCGNSDGSISLAVTGGTTGYSYSWSATGATGQTATNLGSGMYTATVTDAKGCTISTSATINNSNGPTATAAVSAAIKCNGQTGNVTAAASNGTSPYTYSWSTGQSSVTSALNNTVAAVKSAIYSVTITDSKGCTSSSVILLDEPSALIATSTATDEICGNAQGNISVNSSGGTGALTYSWSNSGSGSTVSGLSAGTYSVTLTDANGCTISTTSVINNINNLNGSVATSQATITPGSSTLLFGSASGGTGVSYTWTPSGSLSCNNCATTTANPKATTTYTLYVKDNNNCVDSAEITITVGKLCAGTDADVYIANIFSPNGDGKNDMLNIEGGNLTNIYWAIYDRWGNLIFETSDQAQGWDGTKKGSPMESATYVYYLKATCISTNSEIKLKGNVTIVK